MHVFFYFSVRKYLIHLAPAYMANNLQDDRFTMWYHQDFADLIRIKTHSRFRSNKTYTHWVQFQPNGVGPHAIQGWNCTCPVGSRVVGMCSHVAATIWYLGYGRHLGHSVVPAEDVGNTLIDPNVFQYECKKPLLILS